MTADDRLFDELLRPIVESFYEGCSALAQMSDDADRSVRAAFLGRLNALEEVGSRTARVLGVAEPLWEDMRGLAGLSL